MLNHKFLSGQFKDISYTNFTAAKNIYKDKNSMAFRAIVGKEQEGPYISIPRASLSYGYELKLSSNVYFSSGVSLGATGVYFATPSLSSSFILPDGVLGLGLKVKKTYIGLSALQVFNTGQPSFFLKRYYNILLMNELDLSHKWRLKNQFFARYLSSDKYEMKYAFLASFDQLVDIGIALRTKSGLSFLATFMLPMKENKLNLSFAYNTNYVRQQNYYIPNSMELVLGIVLD